MEHKYVLLEKEINGKKYYTAYIERKFWFIKYRVWYWIRPMCGGTGDYGGPDYSIRSHDWIEDKEYVKKHMQEKCDYYNLMYQKPEIKVVQ